MSTSAGASAPVFSYAQAAKGLTPATSTQTTSRNESPAASEKSTKDKVGPDTGSNALIKREALLAAGGFDETLRTRGGQGCEDWKLYLQVAERYNVCMVPEYLIGYRIAPGSMSEDFQQMMRSRRLVQIEFSSAYPNLLPQFGRGEVILARSLALRAINRGQIREAMALLRHLSRGTPSVGFAALIWLIRGALRRAVRWIIADDRPAPYQFLQKVPK